MELHKISVIIPVYNAEQYIDRCISSVISNTYKNLEIIVVDDGSTDNSLSILNGQNDNRIMVLQKENGGVSSARNAGLRFATGDYISFVDADDWVHAQYFEILHQAIGESQIAHCSMERTSSFDILHATGKQIMENRRCVTSNESFYLAGVKNYVCGKLFDKQSLKGITFPENVKMAEDKVFVSEVLNHIKEITIIDNKLYYYYTREDSAIHTYGSDLFPSAKAYIELFRKYKNPIMLENAYSALLSHRYLNMFNTGRNKNQEEINSTFIECSKMSNGYFTLKKRVMYELMANFPMIYRAYRLLSDKTMFKWEKEEKKRWKNV